MNFSIKNTENSLQNKYGSSNFDLSQNLALSKESKINMNFDQKFSFKQTENSKQLNNYNENVHVIDLYEVNEMLLIEVLVKIPELSSPKKFNFSIINSIDQDGDGHIVDIIASPTGLNTTNTSL